MCSFREARVPGRSSWKPVGSSRTRALTRCRCAISRSVSASGPLALQAPPEQGERGGSADLDWIRGKTELFEAALQTPEQPLLAMAQAYRTYAHRHPTSTG